MRASVYRTYGPPDVLRVEDVPDPEVKGDHVLVRVAAAALNPLDWHLVRGKPYMVRPTAGWLRPKRNIPGVDVAGVVEAVGPGVTDLRPGDEVFGEKSRACAEYVAGPERLFVRKPANLTLEQAAAVPVAAMTALQALRDRGRLQPGQTVLINGASGGVGTFAIQLARHLGAEVTGVCSTRNVELVRSLGAHHVIDYTTTDFARTGRRYDLIVDSAANRSLFAMRRALTATGTAVLVGAPRGDWIAPLVRMALGRVLSRRGGPTLAPFLTDVRRGDLEFIKKLAEAGTLTPVIDRRYGLSEVAEGLRYLETMRARGKVLITM